MKISFLSIFLLLSIAATAQVMTRVVRPASVDSLSVGKPSPRQGTYTPETRNADIPFIDYKPAIVYLTPSDTLMDFAYIRQNFTDQLVSVWNVPGRYYPASRIHAVGIDGRYYRSVRKNAVEFIFAERAVTGPMSLYLYHKIPQVNGWVECYSAGGYTNNMIVENRVTRNKEAFGYYVTLQEDSTTFIPLQDMESFAAKYLALTPGAYEKARPFMAARGNKERKILVASIMGAGLLGTILMSSQARWLFLAGFPLAAIMATANRAHNLHWQDVVEIVHTYNSEVAKQ